MDTAALDWLAERTSAILTVVVPCRVADQPGPAAEAIARWQAGNRIDRVVELGSATLGTPAYHARNRWMVDHSGMVIGFPRGVDSTRGTWYTISYAAGQGKPRLIVPV